MDKDVMERGTNAILNPLMQAGFAVFSVLQLGVIVWMMMHFTNALDRNTNSITELKQEIIRARLQ